MNWEKDSIIFIIAFLILRELVSLIVWFIKRKDKNLDEIAFKLTKEKMEWWKGSHGTFLDFPMLSYYLMLKRVLEKRDFDPMLGHIDFIAQEAKLLDDSIEEMKQEEKNLEGERKRLEDVKDDIETAYSELHKIEKEKKAQDLMDFLSLPLYQIIWMKLTEKRKRRKLKEMSDELERLKEKRNS